MNLYGAYMFLEFRLKGEIGAPISNQEHRDRREMKDLFYRLLILGFKGDLQLSFVISGT